MSQLEPLGDILRPGPVVVVKANHARRSAEERGLKPVIIPLRSERPRYFGSLGSLQGFFLPPGFLRDGAIRPKLCGHQLLRRLD